MKGRKLCHQSALNRLASIMNEGRAPWWNQVCPRDKLNNSCDGTNSPAPPTPHLSDGSTLLSTLSSVNTTILQVYCVQLELAPLSVTPAAAIRSPRSIRRIQSIRTAHSNTRRCLAPSPCLFSLCHLSKHDRIQFSLVFTRLSCWEFREDVELVAQKWGHTSLVFLARTTQLELSSLWQAKVPVSGISVGGVDLSDPQWLR